MKDKLLELSFHPSSLIPLPLFRLFVPRVFTAASAELLKLQTLRRRLFVFRRRVITTPTSLTLQHYIIARHSLPLKSLFNNFGDSACSHCPPAFSNRKPQPLLHRDRRN